MKNNLTEDDLKTVVRYLLRYSTAKPRIAIARLLEIELIRNNFTKSYLHNLLQGVKLTVERGTKHRYLTNQMYDILKSIMEAVENKEKQEATEPTLIEPAKVSPDEVLAKLANDLQVIEEKALAEIKEIEMKKLELEDRREKVHAAREALLADIKQQMIFWTKLKYQDEWLETK